MILTSDASAAAGAPRGEYRLAGRPVQRDPAGAVRTTEGVLAGSGVLLDEAVREWTRATGAAGADALAAATIRPARAIGLSSGLTPGASADLVLADADGRPRRIMRGGRWLEPDAP